jgi:hypothetical protein
LWKRDRVPYFWARELRKRKGIAMDLLRIEMESLASFTIALGLIIYGSYYWWFIVDTVKVTFSKNPHLCKMDI